MSSHFAERLVCTVLMSVGVWLVLDSQGIHLGTEGILGASLAFAGLAFLIMPDERA